MIISRHADNTRHIGIGLALSLALSKEAGSMLICDQITITEDAFDASFIVQGTSFLPVARYDKREPAIYDALARALLLGFPPSESLADVDLSTCKRDWIATVGGKRLEVTSAHAQKSYLLADGIPIAEIPNDEETRQMICSSASRLSSLFGERALGKIEPISGFKVGDGSVYLYVCGGDRYCAAVQKDREMTYHFGEYHHVADNANLNVAMTFVHRDLFPPILGHHLPEKYVFHGAQLRALYDLSNVIIERYIGKTDGERQRRDFEVNAAELLNAIRLTNVNGVLISNHHVHVGRVMLNWTLRSTLGFVTNGGRFVSPAVIPVLGVAAQVARGAPGRAGLNHVYLVPSVNGDCEVIATDGSMWLKVTVPANLYTVIVFPPDFAEYFARIATQSEDLHVIEGSYVGLRAIEAGAAYAIAKRDWQPPSLDLRPIFVAGTVLGDELDPALAWLLGCKGNEITLEDYGGRLMLRAEKGGEPIGYAEKSLMCRVGADAVAKALQALKALRSEDKIRVSVAIMNAEKTALVFAARNVTCAVSATEVK